MNPGNPTEKPFASQDKVRLKDAPEIGEGEIVEVQDGKAKVFFPSSFDWFLFDRLEKVDPQS